jgi:hypothetical protein
MGALEQTKIKESQSMHEGMDKKTEMGSKIVKIKPMPKQKEIAKQARACRPQGE